MQFHRNAKLGLAGRHELVLAIERGSSIRQAAASFHVSPATAHRWWRRWRRASARERVGLGCLCDRSSRPARSPRRLARASERAICDCRRKTGWGPRLVAGATGFAHSTVWKVLRRFGLSRPRPDPREPANRYEWPCPGDLLHMDTSRYARFLRPGHRVTGDRSQSLRGRSSRSPGRSTTTLTRSSTITPDSPTSRSTTTKEPPTVTAFVERALAFFAAHGITARRLMTDNAFVYVRSRSLRRTPRRPDRSGICTTQPYRPRTNGKVERFHQTMAREWAYGLSYRSHQRPAGFCVSDWRPGRSSGDGEDGDPGRAD